MAKSELKEGSKAPDFRAESSGGGFLSLSDFEGKHLVLYFYPKDNTPGCNKEACAFRDANAEMKKLGAAVVGVSKDSLASHGKFKEKFSLNFPLLSDPDTKMIGDYGVWKEKTMFGKTALGVVRSTFLIDPEGVIVKIWRRVKVDGHSEQVLAALKEAKGG